MQPSPTVGKPQRIDTGVGKSLRQPTQETSWRNGSASDSRSEGCVFKSRRGHVGFHRHPGWSSASPTHHTTGGSHRHRVHSTSSIALRRLVEAPNPKQRRPGRRPSAGIFTALGGGSPCLKLRRMKQLKPARVPRWFLAFTRLCVLMRNTVRGPSKGMLMDCPASTVCWKNKLPP